MTTSLPPPLDLDLCSPVLGVLSMNVPVKVLTCAYRSEGVRIGESSKDANPIEMQNRMVSRRGAHSSLFRWLFAGYSLVGVLELCAHRHDAV